MLAGTCAGVEDECWNWDGGSVLCSALSVLLMLLCCLVLGEESKVEKCEVEEEERNHKDAAWSRFSRRLLSRASLSSLSDGKLVVGRKVEVVIVGRWQRDRFFAGGSSC